jgi:hypothetical protein
MAYRNPSRRRPPFFLQQPLVREGDLRRAVAGSDRLPRKTDRLQGALVLIGFAVGGRAGARLAKELGQLAGRDTLLRRVRSAPLPGSSEVRVLGVDDWARRKGVASARSWSISNAAKPSIFCPIEKRRALRIGCGLIRSSSSSAAIGPVLTWMGLAREHRRRCKASRSLASVQEPDRRGGTLRGSASPSRTPGREKRRPDATTDRLFTGRMF